MIGGDGHLLLTGFQFSLSSLPTRSSFVPAKDYPVVLQVPAREQEYRAPELLLGWTEDEAVDSWSFGCLLYFMAVGKVC
jgi:serine/threonine protein kinase